jgi:hypothetical protein
MSLNISRPAIAMAIAAVQDLGCREAGSEGCLAGREVLDVVNQLLVRQAKVLGRPRRKHLECTGS